MKKLILLAVMVTMLFTACGNRGVEENRDMNNANDGVVTDGDGVIDENNNADDDNIIDDAADGAENVIDGATDAVDDAVGGVKNAVDDMTGNDNNMKSGTSNK